MDAELERGRHAQVVGELETLAAEHPYQERVAALLMLALYRSGRQADALAVYRAVRRRLSDELGLEPAHELRDLEARILRQDPTLVLPVPAPPSTPAATGPGSASRRARRRLSIPSTGLVAGLGLLAGAGLFVAALLVWRADAAAVTVPANSLAFIDPATNEIEATIQVGIRPGAVVSGGSSLWVANRDDRTVTRIDTARRSVLRTISIGVTPDGLAAGEGAVWVVNGRLGRLYRIDPRFNSLSGKSRLGGRAITYVDGSVDVGEGYVWAAFADSTLARVDPRTLSATTSRVAAVGPTSVVVAFGSVWVSTDDPSRGVQRFSPETFDEGAFAELASGRTPAGLAAGAGSIWVANTDEDSVTRLDPATAGFNSSLPIEVGDGPTALAFGAGSLWVANTAAGTISRIDPQTNEVEAVIEVGNAPAGIAVTERWAAVTVQAP